MSSGRQLGLLWGGVAAVLMLLSPWAEALAATLPACPVKTLLGVPCPSCGAARSALALARLDLAAAVAASPLAAAGWLALVGGGILASLLALGGREVPEPRVLPRPIRLGAAAAILANWLYLLRAGI